MSEAIWVAIIGLLAGAVGSLAAPWAQWGVEKRRERLHHRRAMIATWRDGIVVWRKGQTAAMHQHRTAPAYIHSAWFLSLRPNLDPLIVSVLTTTMEPVDGPKERWSQLRVLATRLNQEVDRLEREWGLI